MGVGQLPSTLWRDILLQLGCTSEAVSLACIRASKQDALLAGHLGGSSFSLSLPGPCATVIERRAGSGVVRPWGVVFLFWTWGARMRDTISVAGDTARKSNS